FLLRQDASQLLEVSETRSGFGCISIEWQMSQWHCSIDSDIETKLNLFDIFASTFGSTICGHGCRPGLPFGEVDFIGAEEFDIRDVVMDLAHIQLEPADSAENQCGFDRLAMIGNPFQSSSETIVIELVGGEAEIVGDACGVSPLTDTKHRFGLKQSVDDQDLDQDAERDFALPRHDPIDSLTQLQEITETTDNGQRTHALRIETGRRIHARPSLASKNPS